MALNLLTSPQRERLDALVAAGRLREVPADLELAANCLALADDRLSDLPLIRTTTVRMSTAYDAAHDIGQAFLAAYGYTPTNGAGQHAVIGDFLVIAIPEPPSAAGAARDFDRARRARNNQNYRAALTGERPAADVERIARELRDAATRAGIPG